MDNYESEEFDMNRWNGKSPEEVLSESFHELRDPIYVMTGYLGVLNETDVSAEQLKSILDNMLRYSIYTKQIVDSVYHYLKVRRGEA